MNDLTKYTKPYNTEVMYSVMPFLLNHPRDAEFGGYFACLNQKGEPLLDLMGGKWKVCFYVHRGLNKVWKTLDLCLLFP